MKVPPLRYVLLYCSLESNLKVSSQYMVGHVYLKDNVDVCT